MMLEFMGVRFKIQGVSVRLAGHVFMNFAIVSLLL